MRAVLLALLLPCAALAQNDDLPPPGAPTTSSANATATTLIDDRDVASSAQGEDVPMPEKILEPPPPEAAPTVSIRTDSSSGDVVEEYRTGGRISMVKVHPRGGAPYTLIDSNGDGLLDRKDGEGPVRPVYWTIYEWN